MKIISLVRQACRTLLALGAALSLAAPAVAVPIPFDFKVGFGSGPLAGTSAIGGFTVDSNDCPASICSGAFTPGDPAHTLLGFQVTVAGLTFAATADSGYPAFPTVSLVNNALTGLDFLADLALPSLSLSATVAAPGGPLAATGVYTDGAGRASLVTSVQAIPEPETFTLLAAGMLVGLATVRRRLRR